MSLLAFLLLILDTLCLRFFVFALDILGNLSQNSINFMLKHVSELLLHFRTQTVLFAEVSSQGFSSVVFVNDDSLQALLPNIYIHE